MIYIEGEFLDDATFAALFDAAKVIAPHEFRRIKRSDEGLHYFLAVCDDTEREQLHEAAAKMLKIFRWSWS